MIHYETVVAFCRSVQRVNFDLAQALRRIGFHVLIFFYSGSWGSDGTFSFTNSLHDPNAKNVFFECLDEGIRYLPGTSRDSLIEEIASNPQMFSFQHFLQPLSEKPILWISSKTDPVTPEDQCTRPFMNQLKKHPDNKIVWRSIRSDHYLSNARVRISKEIAYFLNANIEHSKSSINYSTFTEELDDLICKNYLTITLSDAADYFKVGVPYLSSLIHQKTGSNFTAIITNHKMKEASQLLKTTDLPIHAISDSLGFTNSSYFMKVFKKYFGCTPTQYRAVVQEKN